MNDLSFSSLPISAEILNALSDMGFEEPTPIQAQTIPYILESRDLLGQAQTGTGKTCAFGIPVIDSVDSGSNHIQTLILSLQYRLRRNSITSPNIKKASASWRYTEDSPSTGRSSR